MAHLKDSLQMKLLSILIWFSCLLFAKAEDIAAIIDPNVSGVVERSPNSVVTSVCTILTLPDLVTKGSMVFGEKMAATLIGSDFLLLTGQGIGNDARLLSRNPFNEQIFSIFSLNPISKITQFSYPGFLYSFDAIYPEIGSYLKSNSDSAFAMMFDEAGLKQNLVAISTSGKTINTYSIPAEEVQLTEFYPFKKQFILLNILPRGTGNNSILKLLDISKEKVQQTIHMNGHVRRIFSNQVPYDDYYLIIDSPILGKAPSVELVKNDNGKLFLKPKRMPLELDWKKYGIIQGMRINKDVIMLGAGNGNNILDLYLVDFKTETSHAFLKLNNKPHNFSISSDGKYLITVGQEVPQVVVYDMGTGKKLNQRDILGYNPLIIVSN